MEDKEGKEDFVWRFQLSRNAAPAAELDPMVEMIRSFLADFFQIGFLTRNGERVNADGFVFTANPDAVHKIFPNKTV
jgi:hypothetical protein